MRDAEVGSTANKYTIVAKLATGGMAELFLARNESTAGVERYVVLKRVLRQHANDINFVNMFLDEARLSARLQHPNIAQVYDTGKLGDSYFFTMEYVHGETIRSVLHAAHEANQRVPVAAALTIIAGAAAGLQHAHERVGFDGRPLGIVHRDVSPSNLMVSYEGNVKLVDFGVAKATHRAHQTQTGALKGKVGYMSPEQIRNAVVDPRCDLFSLGIVMWELLVGDRLFKRAGDFETMEAIISDPVPPPSTRRAGLSPEIDAIACKLLEKSPALRYQTAYELLEALEVATVRAGLPLSVSGVRRFMQDLYGDRPEPWVELARTDAHTDVVTIIGQQLDDPRDEETVSAQLDHVLDLSKVLQAAELPAGDELLDDDEPPPDRAAVRVAAISTTTPTVADLVRPPTVPPPPSPTRISAPLAMTAMPMPVRTSSVIEVPSRRWMSPRPLLLGGAIVVCAVIGFVLASGDKTAEAVGGTSASPRAEPLVARPAATDLTTAPAARPEPTATPATVDQAPAPDPVDIDDVAIERNAVTIPAMGNRSSASQRGRAALMPPHSTATKRTRGATRRQSGSQRDSDPDGVSPPLDVKPVERKRPEPTPKSKRGCDETDPLACRR